MGELTDSQKEFAERAAFDKLRNLVRSLPTGDLSAKDQNGVISLLGQCWDEFLGANNTKMAAFKIGRAESVSIISPTMLEFEIERHGGTSLGSIYAELQTWTVNLDDKRVDLNPFPRRRQLEPRGKSYTKKQAIDDAKSVAEAIISNKADLRLKWFHKSKVRVLTGKIVPETCERTTTARRKRLRKALEDTLKPFGWEQTSSNIYEKKGGSSV